MNANNFEFLSNEGNWTALTRFARLELLKRGVPMCFKSEDSLVNSAAFALWRAMRAQGNRFGSESEPEKLKRLLCGFIRIKAKSAARTWAANLKAIPVSKVAPDQIHDSSVGPIEADQRLTEFMDLLSERLKAKCRTAKSWQMAREVVQLRLQGLTQVEIGKELGIHRRRVQSLEEIARSILKALKDDLIQS